MALKTETVLKRYTQEFQKHAGDEAITVELISGVPYAFGSELATLRLLKVYRHCGDRARQDYSTNMGTFYFSLEPQF